YTRAGPVLRYTPSASTPDGSMAVLLITAPSGARLPRGNVTVLVRPRSRARRIHDDVVRVHAVLLHQTLAQRGASRGALPPVERPAEGLAGHGQAALVEQAPAAEVQHHLGHAAGQEHAHRRMIPGAVRQHVHPARHPPVDVDPVLHDGTPKT